MKEEERRGKEGKEREGKGKGVCKGRKEQVEEERIEQGKEWERDWKGEGRD